MQELIAISGKQLVGKDCLADYLLQDLAVHGFHKTPLAHGIKEEFANLYTLTPHAIDEQKAIYRPGLIALGQRRRLGDADYWLKRVMDKPGPKIISDVRLLHEYAFFRDKGAFMIRLSATDVVRATRGQIVSADDPTECELDTVTQWDVTLENNDSPEALRQKAGELAQRILAIQV